MLLSLKCGGNLLDANSSNQPADALEVPANVVMLCLQDTLKGPGEAKKLKKATTFSVAITTFFYLTVGLIGYSA